ncbi:Pyruvate kinase family protein [Thioalkalivibrio nitratireducens DSM 14787]|uniref:pyruvate kinase n=1 Tax=Thioalkalivibrio nitratireducens (strain DSM 14787 / UNIQEM 213 / ALEN2) TaxID=1255043 RepID=L0DUJ2_THIND|nr:pyruvate kinase [Thioalkalivibrio nitratireducens]AGA32672.1 Pyruvate kinase family protein [Thioalkalivibrio nitratireducens DSM 14787]
MTNLDQPGVDGEYRALLEEMHALRQQVVDGAATRLQELAARKESGDFPASACNLAQYLAMRCRDLRPLQLRLARKGLSSLGRVEAHVLASIDEVIRVLSGLCAEPEPMLEPPPAPGFDAGNELLALNTRTLFGLPRPGRTARVMVTMPTAAASDGELVRALLESGMDCARINCAHDSPAVWRRMIDNIRQAQRVVGRDCRVVMDLAGHKVRTGPLADEPAATQLRPQRDAFSGGRKPVAVRLAPESATAVEPPASGQPPTMTVDPRVLAMLSPGDRLSFSDLRGKTRKLIVERELDDSTWLARCPRRAVIGPGTSMRLMRRANGRWAPVDAEPVYLGGHRTRPMRIVLQLGDALNLTRPELPGRPARLDADGRVVEPARIGVTAASVLKCLSPGQAVWIDDGKLGAVVVESDSRSALLKVTHAPPEGFRLKADKGINFPGAQLQLGPLSEKDLTDLDFVVSHGDLVGFSFVQTASDMRALMEELKRRSAGDLGIVAKIETERALRHLPDIMLSAIGRHPLAIMIARGDLAVEIGGERLAEIQEELLWMAEAGHVPVVWATQVLESLAKTGSASRPELSDAAMSVRAECVMLNKGPFIVTALRVLDDILRRMQDHQQKKMPQLRALQLAAGGAGIKGAGVSAQLASAAKSSTESDATAAPITAPASTSLG